MLYYFYFDVIFNIYSLREVIKVLMGIYEFSKDIFFFYLLKMWIWIFFCCENIVVLLCNIVVDIIM